MGVLYIIHNIYPAGQADNLQHSKRITDTPQSEITSRHENTSKRNRRPQLHTCIHSPHSTPRTHATYHDQRRKIYPRPEGLRVLNIIHYIYPSLQTDDLHANTEHTRKRTALDQGSRSDQPRCSTLLALTTTLTLTPTLTSTFNRLRTMAMIHTHTKIKVMRQFAKKDTVTIIGRTDTADCTIYFSRPRKRKELRVLGEGVTAVVSASASLDIGATGFQGSHCMRVNSGKF